MALFKKSKMITETLFLFKKKKKMLLNIWVNSFDQQNSKIFAKLHRSYHLTIYLIVRILNSRHESNNELKSLSIGFIIYSYYLCTFANHTTLSSAIFFSCYHFWEKCWIKITRTPCVFSIRRDMYVYLNYNFYTFKRYEI